MNVYAGYAFEGEITTEFTSEGFNTKIFFS